MTVISTPVKRPTARLNNGDHAWIMLYGDKHKFPNVEPKYQTEFKMSEEDTFSAASHYACPCCLNFASHSRPGGGYKSVMDVPRPIKTQEEDLFRRSNLPGLMNNKKVRDLYPLRWAEGLYTPEVIVSKDNYIRSVTPFKVSLVTVPAVVNPDIPGWYNALGDSGDRSNDVALKQELVRLRAKRIFEIAADQSQSVLILGAWGCGVFNNDPKKVAELFMDLLTHQFRGVFEVVIFAIPGRESTNYRVFDEVVLRETAQQWNM